MKKDMLRHIVFFAAALLPVFPLPAQDLRGGDWIFRAVTPAGKHRGAVTALAHRGETILSAGEDGFLEIWDIRGETALERFQVSALPLIAMAVRPGKNEVCLIESDGLGWRRLSVWDFALREKKFSLPFKDSIAYAAYSAGGSFIIAAGTGMNPLALVDSDLGEISAFPESLSGVVGAAATGTTERKMLAYLLSGVISYRDIESGEETNRFDTQANLSSPLVFGNNRYIAGVDSDGLALIDAASGNVLDRSRQISPDALLSASGDELFCLSRSGASREIYHFTVDRQGRLSLLERISLTPNTGSISAIAAGQDSIALGTSGGEILLCRRGRQPLPFISRDQVCVTAFAVSGATLAVITKNGSIAFIPSDYEALTAERKITFEENNGGTRVSAWNGGGEFIFWQHRNTDDFPFLKSEGTAARTLDGIAMRSPLRAVHSLGGRLLLLDSSGGLSIVSAGNGGEKPLFSFSSAGSHDAVFSDADNIIIARSAVSGAMPFVRINIKTGETVPLPWTAQAGFMLYPGESGAVYGAALDLENGVITTSILRLSGVSRPERLVEFQGEDSNFSLAESEGVLAATLGGEGAALYFADGAENFRRGTALPLRLAASGSRFISLDADGALCWHDNRTGELLAIFRFYQNEWTLQTPQGVIKGAVENPAERTHGL